MPIFLDDIDYRHFMHLFGRTMEQFSVECWNYCLMPNHYHATLRPTLPNLSDAVRQLNGEYARWWNKKYDRVGHVFQGRFKAQIVQREGYPLALSRYVALNPVRGRLVARPEEWPWSSYAAIIGLRTAPPFLAIDSTLALFGGCDQTALRARFVEYVVADHEDNGLDYRIRSSEQILGDKPFKEWIRRGPQASADEGGAPSPP